MNLIYESRITILDIDDDFHNEIICSAVADRGDMVNVYKYDGTLYWPTEGKSFGIGDIDVDWIPEVVIIDTNKRKRSPV